MSVFVDTSAFYALLDSADASHDEAAETWERLVRAGEPLVTSNCVLVETTALVQRRLGLKAVRAFLDATVDLVDVIWVDEAARKSALSAVLAANRRDLSLVDCASFEVMRVEGLSRAFAFDDDFARQGFESA